MQQNQQTQCIICLNEIDKITPFLKNRQGIMIPNHLQLVSCGHEFHITCVKESILNQLESWTFSYKKFICYMDNCGQAIIQNEQSGFEQLKNLVFPDETEWNKVKQKMDKQDHGIEFILCSSCKQEFEKVNSQSQIYYQCPKCNFKMCIKCEKQYHPESQVCISNLESGLKVMKNIQTNNYQDRLLRICPHCKNIFHKSPQNDIICVCPCNQQFCFQCSAPMIPIQNHGVMFHRIGCQTEDGIKCYDDNYKGYSDETLEQCKKHCQLCRENNKRCEYPDTFLNFYLSLGIPAEILLEYMEIIIPCFAQKTIKDNIDKFPKFKK